MHYPNNLMLYVIISYLYQAYFPVNLKKAHWITVVMHVGKKEFQTLDSLSWDSASKAFVKKLVCSLLTKSDRRNINSIDCTKFLCFTENRNRE